MASKGKKQKQTAASKISTHKPDNPHERPCGIDWSISRKCLPDMPFEDDLILSFCKTKKRRCNAIIFLHKHSRILSSTLTPGRVGGSLEETGDTLFVALAPLVGVGNEQSAGRESHSSFIDTATPLKVLRVLNALLPCKGSIQQAVAGELSRTGSAQLGQSIGLLSAAPAAGALGAVQLVVAGHVLDVLDDHTTRTLGRVAGAPAGLVAAAAAGDAVGEAALAAGGAAAAAAPRPTVVQPAHRQVVLVAVLALDLRRAQPHRHAADPDVVVLRRVPYHPGLPVVSDLRRYFTRRAADPRRRARLRRAAGDFLVRSQLRRALLGCHSRVLELCAVAPYCGFLLAE